jgi:hypothetical protein
MNVLIPKHQVQGMLSALRHSASREVDPIIPAWGILCRIASELTPTRRCQQLIFRFDGGARFVEVQVAAVLDDKCQVILELDELLDCAVGPDHKLNEILLQGVQCYLDRHLPRWRVEQGAYGVINVASTGTESEPLRIAGFGQLRSLRLVPVSFPVQA